jgi:hypothetical protein
MLKANRRFARDLRLALSTDDPELARQLMVELEIMQLGRGGFSERCFRQLMKAFASRQFAQSRRAGISILVGLYVQWERLSPAQRRRLGSVLERAYPRITPAAWMLCFTISELIGERMHDSLALGIFTRLLSVGRDHSRKFVPHGFEHIVGQSQNREVARSALEKLNQCATDRSQAVREEAEESLQRLQRRAKG